MHGFRVSICQHSVLTLDNSIYTRLYHRDVHIYGVVSAWQFQPLEFRFNFVIGGNRRLFGMGHDFAQPNMAMAIILNLKCCRKARCVIRYYVNTSGDQAD